MTRPRRQPAERRSSPARLPATLLLAFLALVGATVLGLNMWGGAPKKPGPGDGPQAEVPLAGAAEPESAAPAAEPPEATQAPESRDPLPPPQPPPQPEPAGEAEGAASIAPPPAAPQLRLPPVPTGPALKPAPDPGLVEPTPAGSLPKAGLDGREPWRVYARPFDAADKRPRIAIAIHGLGVGEVVTRAAIADLPGAVTLSFSPYADDVDQLVARARAAGHEVLLMVPMEPANFPVSDPGPQALMTSLSPEENRQRLHWALTRATGYVGIVAYMGSRFAGSRRHVQPVLAEVKNRGLLLLDYGPGNRSVFAEIAIDLALPLASSAMFVDRHLSAAAIDARLEELEYIARSQGGVVAIARPYPVSIERIAAWATGLKDRGFVLAPISAIAHSAPGQ